MEFKGTKGKWTYEYDNSDYNPTEWYTIFSDKGSVLSRNYNERNFQEEEMRANALLISKAPEMLEMLQYFIDNNMISVKADEMAIELIKQATEL